MNTADSASVPAEANVVVVTAAVATPPPFTATGAPMLVPPTSNCTVPAGVVLSAADTFAVSVTVAPVPAGLGDAVSVVVVAVITGPVPLVENVPPLEGTVTNVDWVNAAVPVPPDPL